MINIEEKYAKVRHLLKRGDLILFHGNGVLAKIIQSSDHYKNGDWAIANHVGVIIECEGALGICDANGDGVQWDRLSWRIKKYSRGNFCVIRPKVNNQELDWALRKILKRSDDEWKKYDYRNGLKELCNRRWGWNLEVKLSDSKFICSTNDASYAIDLDMVTEEFRRKVVQFPEDYSRYLNRETTEIVVGW